MARAYYNEHDRFAAAVLRELIAEGVIAQGDVDERDIQDVTQSDLDGYDQCHFFAGIGVWSHAMRCAGWPDDRPIWTGSVPCQPFSIAGTQKGQADSRHLWPCFFGLIRQCRPVTVIGEQVSRAIGLGWLDGVSTDLEGEDYAVWPTVLGAHSSGGYHIRQRIYWLAHANRRRCDRRWQSQSRGQQGTRRQQPNGCGRRRSAAEENGQARMVDAKLPGLEGQSGHGNHSNEPGWQPAGSNRPAPATSTVIWIKCADGYSRPVESWSGEMAPETAADLGYLRHAGDPASESAAPWILSPLTDRDSKNRIGRLKGYGNALDAGTATLFLQTVMDAIKEGAKR